MVSQLRLRVEKARTKRSAHEVTELLQAWSTAFHKQTLTLKAFANFSPGLLQPWEPLEADNPNAESVREFSAQGCLNPGNTNPIFMKCNPEGVA